MVISWPHLDTKPRTDALIKKRRFYEIETFIDFSPFIHIFFIIFVIFQKSYDITSYNSVPSSTVLRKSICWMLYYDFDNHFLFHRNDAASICLGEISLMCSFETPLQRFWAQHTSNLKTITLHAPTSFSFWCRIRFMSNTRTYSMG